MFFGLDLRSECGNGFLEMDCEKESVRLADACG